MNDPLKDNHDKFKKKIQSKLDKCSSRYYTKQYPSPRVCYTRKKPVREGYTDAFIKLLNQTKSK